MVERHDEFDRTLEALGNKRESLEAAHQEQLQQLRTQLDALAAAAREAEKLADGREQCLTAGRADVAVSRLGQLPTPDQEPWPTSGRWFRRLTNRAIGWLLRDHLAVLDRRHRALGRCIESYGEELEGLRTALNDKVETLGRCDAAVPSLEALREALNRTVESLHTVAEMPTQLRSLDDAKHAETLQRAVHGPLAKMDLMFDEFGRQQEALLAELVGRRQELDALLATIRQSLTQDSSSS